jgi:lipopolysaccharide export system protein LptA
VIKQFINNIFSIKISSKVIYILLLITFFIQENSSAQAPTKVEILNANFFRSNKSIANGARRLIGNVAFKQDNTIMKCDSAYFYSELNTFDAFGHVHLYKENDNTIDVRSDFLRHNGNTKTAYFRKNVVLRDTQIVLYTDSLDYNIKRDVGYYIYGATIVDSATTLTSTKGYYYNKSNTIYFKKNVIISHNNGEYKMFTDTLKYNTISDITYFFGPTEFFNDTNYMYAEFGWYNTTNNKSFFKQNALYTNPKQSLEADSIYYDKDNGRGIAYSNIVATDSSQNIVIKGNLLKIYENQDKLIVTDSALIISVFEDDSVFMHADSLIVEPDTSGEYKVFKAFYHTRIFKSDFQVQTDSLYFSTVDSIIQFHGTPVMWAMGNQITARYIEGFIVNQTLDRFKLYDDGLIVSQEDTAYFNQVKGDDITGYFRNNYLYKIDVYKKSETIYFPTDKYGAIGINKSKSRNITILLKRNKINRIIYRDSYEGGMMPLEELTNKESRVRNFIWLEEYRPKDYYDVFLWRDIDLDKNKKHK